MKAKNFFLDTALVLVVLLGIVFLGGIASGEASVYPLILAGVCVAIAHASRKRRAFFRAKVKRAYMEKFSDFKNAA